VKQVAVGAIVLCLCGCARSSTSEHKLAATAVQGPVGPFVPPLSWAQSTWYLDPQNTVAGSCASDNNRTCSFNTCATSGDGPCKTYGSVVSRWGTTSPTIGQVTTMTWLSAQTSDSDPIVLAPTTTGGAYLELTTLPPVLLTGTLSGVVAVNRTVGTLWQATFATLGATCVSESCLFVDNTTGATAWLVANAGGDAYTLSAPLSPATTTAIGSFYGNIVAELSFANGDAFTVYGPPLSLDVVSAKPVVAASAGAIGGVLLHRVNIATHDGHIEPFEMGAGVLVTESLITRSLQTATTGAWAANASTVWGFSHELYNVWATSSVWVEGQRGFTIIWADAGGTFLTVGGGINSGLNVRLNNANLEQDTILLNGSHGGLVTENALLAGVYIGSGNALYCFGPCSIDFDNTHVSGNDIWGPGEFIVGGTGYLRWRSDTLAKNTFLQTGGMALSGFTSACANNNEAGVAQISCGISVTPSNLDLAYVDGGFGGAAFLSGRGSIFSASP
jgi:hypothetical protein